LRHQPQNGDQAFISVYLCDNRSFRLNFEITLAVADRRFASQVAEMLEDDFARSVEVGRDDYESRSLTFKVGVIPAHQVSQHVFHRPVAEKLRACLKIDERGSFDASYVV